MKVRTFLLMLSMLFTAAIVFAQNPPEGQVKADKPRVLMETSMGDIEIELDPEQAPLSVQNFLDYASSGFYDGTIFHRVVNDFVIQGGAYTEDLKEKKAGEPIPNEANNGLKNRRGTIAVARPIEIDSATSQFFFNLVDNRILDHKDDSVQGYGYAVFGKVVKGMSVLDQIALVKTSKQKAMKYVPVAPVVVKSVRQLPDPENEEPKRRETKSGAPEK